MWGDAFLEQARSDWKAYNEIKKVELDVCHQLYYLRAATEKLGKAALLKSGNQSPDDIRTHKKFVRYLQISTINIKLCKVLGIQQGQLKPYINDVLPIAQRIENLAPEKESNRPNAEYPWEAAGNIIAPSSYDFQEARDINSSNGRKLLRLVRLILERFEEVY
ncbi:hypothetical protein CO110_02620 [Candidatus Desantisbacteria bacterium CG_4_9_14_3_um_filter_40_11]|uniref:HEPN domain-containing protein n=2 Tax=unclassified Candidatus Desantisiibacteriota TaxID=3106372 RepID=A0A2M8AV14_9BACT|nr:MAG: hypothetical protein COX18_10110 [Candidatus Desantisbacteria bacterium CG23_combo_of_CG06-09_8_20_14_all_40_23]PJB30040.1 MAG: hypothetical protein CO110_02620 [Candidatus Desantisbacteria bacterium CG_4_9_14_3_um_filter_40_11]